MTGIKIPGLGARAEATRITDGVGHVRERTVEIGNTVITVENIGSITLYDGERTHGPAWLGLILIVWSLGLSPMRLPGAVLMIAGAGLIIWNFVRSVDVFLSIGSADGRFTEIVSTNKKFLMELRDALRVKLDTNNLGLTGTINITNSSFEVSDGGSLCVGDGNVVAGRASHLEVVGR